MEKDQPLQGSSSKKWQKEAAYLVERAEQYLWHPASSSEWWSEGDKALDYLYSIGITDETIRHFHLGYMPKLAQFPFSDWGIDPVQLSQKQRAKGGINVPDGIIIPWCCNGQVVKLTVKRPGQTPEYGQIVGSSECLFNGDSIQPDKPALLVESELNAMSIWEQASDLVGVVATGGMNKCRSAQWIADLSLASLMLQAFEDDEAADYWTQMLPLCVRWPGNKEIAIKDWIAYGIEVIHSDMTSNDHKCPNFKRESPLQGNAIDLPIPEITPSDLPKNRVLSKQEALDIFQQEVARLWGSCTIQEIPMNISLKEYMRQRTRQFSAAHYWKAPVN